MARPFMRSSIGELEQMFAARGSNAEFLSVLSEELRERSTQRARTLRFKVENKLSKMSTVETLTPAIDSLTASNPELSEEKKDRHEAAAFSAGQGEGTAATH